MFGLFVQKQALAIASKIQAGVVAVYFRRGISELSYEIEKCQGILAEIRVYVPVSSLPLLNIFRMYKAFQKGIGLYIQMHGKPDIIHANILTRTVAIGAILSKKLKVPYVVSEHWSRYYSQNFSYTGWFRRVATKFFAKRAKALIVPSLQLMYSMQRLGIKGNYHIVPNVIDTDLFNIYEGRKNDHIKKIVHISCFEDKSKNITGLLSAVKVLRTKRNDFELHLVGTGIDYESIRNFVFNNGMSDYVVFHGLLEGEALAHVLKTATYSVLSSNYETFGIVVYESLACGIPVVVTDVAGLGEIITDAMGIVVPVGNMEKLSLALDTMLEQAQRFQPSTLRSFILSQYTKEAIAKRMLEIYDQDA